MTPMRRWRYNWIVIVAMVVHGGWGAMLLFTPVPLNCTPMADSPFRHNQYLAAAVYLIAAAGAGPTAVGRSGHGFWSLMACLPQQFLMMMSAFTGLRCVWNGAYADGVVRQREFILADQLWVIVGMTVHTLALLDWHYWSRKPSREGV